MKLQDSAAIHTSGQGSSSHSLVVSAGHLPHRDPPFLPALCIDFDLGGAERSKCLQVAISPDDFAVIACVMMAVHRDAALKAFAKAILADGEY